MDFQEFVRLHSGDDTARLLLSRGRWPDVDMDLAVNTIEGRRRMAGKVPEWASNDYLVYPSRLSTEQCSSTATATYKASLAMSLVPQMDLLADLTGGLGVDVWAFSKVFEKVLYNEADPSLCDAAKNNFPALGIENIRICNFRVGESPLAEITGDSRPDIIYMDPARRSSSGSKVFRLADCSPDVEKLLPELMEVCPRLLLKLSPMADLTVLMRSLPGVKQLHCVGSEGECKEVLAYIEKGWSEEPEIIVAELPDRLFRFYQSEEKEAVPVWDDTGKYLLEPSKALAKSGAFNLISERFGIRKAAPSTHLYFSDTIPDGFPGKVFEVIEQVPFCNRSIRDFSIKYAIEGVTARNLPITSDALEKKLGKGKGAAKAHIFAFRSTSDGNVICATRYCAK